MTENDFTMDNGSNENSPNPGDKAISSELKPKGPGMAEGSGLGKILPDAGIDPDNILGMGRLQGEAGSSEAEESTSIMPKDKLSEEILDALTDDERRIQAVLQNKNSTADDIINAKNEAGGVRVGDENKTEELLRTAGHDGDKIDEVMSRIEEMRPSESEESEETPEEIAAVERATGESGEVESIGNSSDTGQELMDRVARGENVSDEELSKFIDDANERKGRIHEFLFNQEAGLLRPEKRLSRLVKKPAITMLVAMLLLYLNSLHIATNWATKRVGGGK